MNNKNSQEQLDKVFLDVRKAYRLIYMFQRRVMDIIQFIGDATLRKYDGGYSKFSNSGPKDGKGTLDKWAWDWLNMYCYEFYFADQKATNGNIIGFSVWLVSDTGFYDAEAGVKQKIETFTSVETSETKLVFVIGKNTCHKDFQDFESILRKEVAEYKPPPNDKGVLLAKSFKLSRFANAEETRKVLLEVVSFCHNYGIPEMTI